MTIFVKDGDTTQAIIIPAAERGPGVHFVTPPDLSQQLAYMCHPSGHVIEPHFHLAVPREVHFTQEVLIINKGRLRVDFYDGSGTYRESRILAAGDVILLIEGGHGFEVLDELEMIEVKQGPYLGAQDKVRFTRADPGQIKVTE
jgi:mannose-6-phosphate isomerase-like protein (cupin superfamily)